MKQNLKMESFYQIQGSWKILMLLIGIFFFFASCSKEEMNETLNVDSLNLKSSSDAVTTTITEVQFTATAMIAYCHGENIRFTGTIQNRVTTNTDARGVVHFTRSFYTKNMTGIGLDPDTDNEYEVLGGAEMFAVKDAVLDSNGNLNLSGSIAESDIVIHQGTLVFRNVADGSKVVARHIIRKVPGSSTVINHWKCGGN